MKKILFYLGIAIFLTSCDFFRPWNFGSGYKLGENTEYQYNIIIDRADTTFWFDWGNGRKTLQEGVLVKFHEKNKIDPHFMWKGTAVISSYINQVEFDSLFVLVDQKPLDSIWGKYFTDKDSVYRRSNEPKKFFDAKKKIKNSKIHCYWIIKKKTDDVYGPLSWKEYLQRRKEIGVPEKLKLKRE